MTDINKLITDNFDIWSGAIKRKSVTGRGSNKKIDLLGVKKLRELILELAVIGKLTTQKSADEPATRLLEKIKIKRESLVKSKLIKKPKKFSEITDAEKYCELPLGWEFARLNDLGEWGSGSTPKRGVSEYYGGSIPWFKSGELNGNYISESEETLTELALQNTSLRLNKVGDVLIAMYGATIGKTSILSVEATTNQAVCACTPFDGFSNRYLLTLLKAFRPKFIGMGAGGAQPNISRDKIIATVIALPPEEEQTRIVEKVEELMALCDQLEQQTEASIDAHQLLVEELLSTLTNSDNAKEFEQNWARIAEHFDLLFTTEHSIEQLKQTILQLAVMGKLVPQDPNDEPASKLLERIAQEKEQLIKGKVIKKQKSLADIAEEEKPFEVPQGWEWARVGDLLSLKNGYAFKSKYFIEKTSEFILTTPGNFYEEGGFRHRGEKTKYYEGPIDPEYIFDSGDLIIPMTEQAAGLLGSAAFIPKDQSKYLHNQRLGKLTPYSNLTTLEFIYLFFNSSFLREELARTCTGMKVRHTSPDRILKVLIPVMPPREQVRITAKVDELLRICEQLKHHLVSAKSTQVQLAESVVEQALS